MTTNKTDLDLWEKEAAVDTFFGEGIYSGIEYRGLKSERILSLISEVRRLRIDLDSEKRSFKIFKDGAERFLKERDELIAKKDEALKFYTDIHEPHRLTIREEIDPEDPGSPWQNNFISGDLIDDQGTKAKEALALTKKEPE